MHDNRKKPVFVHLHNLCGRKGFCHQDHRFITQIDSCGRSSQYPDQTSGDFPDIFKLLRDKGSLQPPEGLCHLVPVEHNRIGGVHFLGLYAVLDGAAETLRLKKFDLPEKGIRLLLIQEAFFLILRFKIRSGVKRGVPESQDLLLHTARHRLADLIFSSAVI